MAILVCSRRGMWFVALGVWLAACAALWWALPVVPRAVIDDVSGEIDFSRDGSRIYIRPGPALPIAIHDSRHGELLRSWKPDGENLRYEPTLDFSVWKLTEDAKAPQLIDLATGRHELVPWWTPDCKAVVHASPDARFFAVAISDNAGMRTVWWDRHDARTVAILENLTALAIGVDGLWLTADVDSNDLLVRSPASAQVVARIPRTSRWTGVDLSSDGTIIVLPSNPTRIFDLKTGTFLCELPTNRDVVVHPEVRLAITLYIENNQLELTRWDMTTGTEVGRHVVALGARELVRSKSYEWPKNGILTFETSSSPFIVQILLRSWLSALPMFSKVYLARTVTYTFFDIRTPCVIGGCTVYDTDRPIARISPDAQTVAVILPGESRLALWDIPPRKSLAHFAAGAAILALPIAFVARRRERELRAT